MTKGAWHLLCGFLVGSILWSGAFLAPVGMDKLIVIQQTWNINFNSSSRDLTLEWYERPVWLQIPWEETSNYHISFTELTQLELYFFPTLTRTVTCTAKKSYFRIYLSYTKYYSWKILFAWIAFIAYTIYKEIEKGKVNGCGCRSCYLFNLYS